MRKDAASQVLCEGLRFGTVTGSQQKEVKGSAHSSSKKSRINKQYQIRASPSGNLGTFRNILKPEGIANFKPSDAIEHEEKDALGPAKTITIWVKIGYLSN